MDAFTPLTKIGLLADETQDDGQLREGNPRSIIQLPPTGNTSIV